MNPKTPCASAQPSQDQFAAVDWQSYRRGDARLLEILYRRYRGVVRQLTRAGFFFSSKGAGGYCRAVAEAEREDVEQEVFRRAFEPGARGRYEPHRPYPAYLRAVARNLVLDRERRRLTEQRSLQTLRDRHPSHGGESDGPEHTLRQAALRQTIRAWLEHLPAILRQLIALRFEEAHSQDQVARQLGLSRGRVRTLERQLQRELKRALGERGLGEHLPCRQPPRVAA